MGIEKAGIRPSLVQRQPASPKRPPPVAVQNEARGTSTRESARTTTDSLRHKLTEPEIAAAEAAEAAALKTSPPAHVEIHVVDYTDPASTNKALKIIRQAAKDNVAVTIGFAGIRTPTHGDAKAYIPTFAQVVPTGKATSPLIILPNGVETPIIGDVVDALRAFFNIVDGPGVPLVNRFIMPRLKEDTTSQFGVGYRLLHEAKRLGVTLNGVAHSNGVVGLTGLTNIVEPEWNNVTLLEGNARAKWFLEMKGNFKSLAISTSECDRALRVALLGGTTRGAEYVADNPALMTSKGAKVRFVIGRHTSHSPYLALELLKKAFPDFDPTK